MVKIKRKSDAERFLAEQEEKIKKECPNPKYQYFSVPTANGRIEIFVGGGYRTFWKGKNGWRSVFSPPREKREVLHIIWGNRKYINLEYGNSKS